MEKQDQAINSVMQTALENIKDMIDVNTVIGDPLVTGSGSTVIPVSKVSFGFVAGGGECMAKAEPNKPFAGGSGAGVSLQPVGFLVLHPEDGVHMLPAQSKLPWEHTITMLPKLISDLKMLFAPEKTTSSAQSTPGDM